MDEKEVIRIDKDIHSKLVSQVKSDFNASRQSIQSTLRWGTRLTELQLKQYNRLNSLLIVAGIDTTEKEEL